MNFDRLAPHYHWLETIFAGGLMQRCRTAFLDQAKKSRHALLVGEGTGKFLTELLRGNPEIKIVCVESCAGMIRQAQRRLVRERMDLARVRFEQVDIFDWTPPVEKFDLVVTNFFLDCFRAGQLQRLVPLLSASTTADAAWLLADFRIPERGWRRWRAKIILASLYACFKISTSLSANQLTPPEPFLASAGFALMERRLANFGLAHADYWRRTI